MATEKPTIDDLLSEAQKGATASAAQEFLKDYIFKKVWKLIIALCNCEQDKLVTVRAEIKAHLSMAQDLKVNVDSAEFAVRRLKELYGQKT